MRGRPHQSTSLPLPPGGQDGPVHLGARYKPLSSREVDPRGTPAGRGVCCGLSGWPGALGPWSPPANGPKMGFHPALVS